MTTSPLLTSAFLTTPPLPSSHGGGCEEGGGEGLSLPSSPPLSLPPSVPPSQRVSLPPSLPTSLLSSLPHSLPSPLLPFLPRSVSLSLSIDTSEPWTCNQGKHSFRAMPAKNLRHKIASSNVLAVPTVAPASRSHSSTCKRRCQCQCVTINASKGTTVCASSRLWTRR